MKSLHMSVKQMWPALVAKLTPAPNRWKNVVGPISTVVATLLQFGWQPDEPLKWRDPEGVLWDLDPSDGLLKPQFAKHLLRQTEIFLWRQASQHHHGADLKLGVDWTVVRNKLKYHLRQGQYTKHAALMTVAQGGVWDPARLATGARLPVPRCEHCRASDSSFAHLVWACPHTKKSDDPRISQTNYLCSEAVLGIDANPGFWLRGLVPWDWTWGAGA